MVDLLSLRASVRSDGALPQLNEKCVDILLYLSQTHELDATGPH
jgi:hypothetical protein